MIAHPVRIKVADVIITVFLPIRSDKSPAGIGLSKLPTYGNAASQDASSVLNGISLSGPRSIGRVGVCQA